MLAGVEGPPPQFTAKTLDDYLEHMSKPVFQAGISWRVVDAKWSGIRTAFKGFKAERVARMSDCDVDTLAKDERVIRAAHRPVQRCARAAASGTEAAFSGAATSGATPVSPIGARQRRSGVVANSMRPRPRSCARYQDSGTSTRPPQRGRGVRDPAIA